MSTEFRLYNYEEKDLFSNKTREEKEALLLDMVLYAKKYGNKPAARKYLTYPGTVRKWVQKYDEFGADGLKYKK